MSGWLDDMLNLGGYATVMAAGSALEQRRTLNVIGGSLSDDAVNQRTIVVIPAGATKPGDSKTLYVDKSGNDATAQRGNIGMPYLTLTAALAAMQSGDQVRMGPGTWAERCTGPELAAWSLVGAGRDVTVIAFDIGAGDASFVVAPQTTPLTSCTLADFSVTNGAALGLALSISGATQPIANLHVRNVGWATDSTAGSEIEFVDVLHEDGCHGDAMLLRAIGSGLVGGGTSHNEATIVSWLNGDAGTNLGVVFDRSCVLDGLELRDEAKVTAACSLGAVTGELTSASAVNLDCAKMSSLAVSRSGGDGRVAVSARGGAIAGEVYAGDTCDIDIRHSAFVQSALTATGSGTIERSRHRQAISLINGNKNVAFAVPFTTPYYSTTIEVWASGTDARVHDAVASDITIASNAIDTNASFILIHD